MAHNWTYSEPRVHFEWKSELYYDYPTATLRETWMPKKCYWSGVASPLMDVGTYVYSHDHSIVGCPYHVLEVGFAATEMRLRVLMHSPDNHKRRATEKWLSRWIQLMDNEMRRQREDKDRGVQST